jgi:16S rRNA (uracil1498-N3)-methyltransferase
MVVPVVAPLATLQGWCAGSQVDGRLAVTTLVLDPRAERSLQDWLAAQRQVEPVAAASWQVVSGPEGGLSDAEVAQLVKLGATPVRLGPRVLRADTAPLAMLAVLGSALED